MRAPAAVLRWLSAGILALGVVLAAAVPAQAQTDTGTYRISNYLVTLEPQPSGQVKMTYQQTWNVLSGSIPWVTLGLPNSHFSIEQQGGAAVGVEPANSGGFTGVRVDLDRTYGAGESFTISFQVLQNNLLERLTQDKKWRINFTPGWYDRAQINYLQVRLVSPVALSTYSSVQPPPAMTADQTLTWNWSNLSAGSRVNVTVECLDGSFLNSTVPIGPGPVRTPINWPVIIVIVVGIFFIALIGFVLWRARQTSDEALKARIAETERQMAEDPAKKAEIEKGFREYVVTEDMQPDEEGRYYDRSYGNYITPAIWAAVILGQQQTRQTGACACVSCACVSCACACACACAGGGAAGCSRKTLHECRECAKQNASGPATARPAEPV